MSLIIDLVGGAALFTAGAFVGVHNVPTVDKAITALKKAEASAINTLTMIGQHKAGTAAPVVVSVTTSTSTTGS